MKGHHDVDFVSLAETKALLKRGLTARDSRLASKDMLSVDDAAEVAKAKGPNSLAARKARLAAGDMLSTDDAAELAGASRVTVNAWIAKGRCIGLTQTIRGFRVPSWQFEPDFWPLVGKLSEALGTTEGWALLGFLEAPHGALCGATPRAAIEQGQGERVLELAQAEGY